MGRLSRNVFKPGENESGVYLHVYNHCVEGPSCEFPFQDVEKEKFIRHLKRTLKLYSIECLSVVVMSNHYHLILYIPKETFSSQDMMKRLVSYKKSNRDIDPQGGYCQRRLEMSNDLSSFMKELQRGFTCWYNKSRSYKRRGTLWEQRFKCTKLIEPEALVTCLQYVELNPVRAEITNDPADYRFSSYGIWQQGGKHPFAQAFRKHMLSALSIYLDSENMKGLEKYFLRRFAGIIAGETGAKQDEVDSAVQNSISNQKSILLRRSRYWIDSAILGSQMALKEHATRIWGQKRAHKKRFGKAYKDKGIEIYGIRQLNGGNL